MDKEQARKLLNKVKADYARGSEVFSNRSKVWESVFALIKKQVGDGQKVLDVGCGDGRYIDALAGKGVEYIGVDSCEEFIKKARRNLEIKKLRNCRFLTGDILDLPFEDGKFSAKGGPASGWDVVLCIAVLHHIPSRELQLKALCEMRRVLKPGGKLIMTNWTLLREIYKPIRIAKLLYCCIVFLLSCFFKKKRKCLGFKDLLIPWGITGNKINRYYYAFSLAELKRLVKKAGFIIDKAYYLGRKKESSFWRAFWKRENLVVVARKK